MIQKCPVCNGCGEVPEGFYRDNSIRCRACLGQGVLRTSPAYPVLPPSPVYPPLPPYIPYRPWPTYPYWPGVTWSGGTTAATSTQMYNGSITASSVSVTPKEA